MYQRLFEHSSKQTVQINGDSVNFDLRLLGRPCNVYLDCINLDAHVPLFLTHPNVRTHIVHLDTTLPSKWTLWHIVFGPSKYIHHWTVYLDRPNGRRSNWLPMLREFGPSKLTTVQWTTYVTLIWTVQMDDGPMERLSYVNLDRPSWQWSNGPPLLR